MYLFKNKNEVHKFYQTDNLNGELIPLEHKKLSPIKYEISAPTKKNIVFTEGYNKNWKLNNQQPTQLGPVNAYEFKEERILNYKRFRIYLVSYILSALAFAYLLVRLLRR